MGDPDLRLIEILSARAAELAGMFRSEGDNGLTRIITERERLFSLVSANNPGPLTDEFLRAIFNDLLYASFDIARPLRVSYLGPDGTFSAVALRQIYGETVTRVPVKTIPDVFAQVETGNADCGVVPVENSTEGAVTFTLDELVETNLRVTGEKYIRISYCLLSPETDPRAVKKIYSHPQPIAQCRNWIRKNMPDAEVITVESTARAAEIVASEPGSGAIAAELNARVYNLNILYRRIEDLRQNFTRFFTVGKQDTPATGHDKTSLVCSVKDQPSALHRLLAPFAESGINMTRIESRPDRRRVWTYNFFIDFTGHRTDTNVRYALERMEQETVFLKILGSYPAGERMSED